MQFSDWLRAKLIDWLNFEPDHPADGLSDFERLSDEIRPGDILLVEGRSQVSRIIKTITQSPWSHAAIYVGRLRNMEVPSHRTRARGFTDQDENSHLIVEAILGKGTIVSPLEHYRHFRVRICRPIGLSRADREQIIGFVIDKLGTDYDLRQVLDLARFMLPYEIIPRRWRSSLFRHNAGTQTRTVCSTLIAEAFEKVGFPILPVVLDDDDGKKLFKRNTRLFTPQDFDFSPYFDIVKFPFHSIREISAYHLLPWHSHENRDSLPEQVALPAVSNRKTSVNDVDIWEYLQGLPLIKRFRTSG